MSQNFEKNLTAAALEAELKKKIAERDRELAAKQAEEKQLAELKAKKAAGITSLAPKRTSLASKDPSVLKAIQEKANEESKARAAAHKEKKAELKRERSAARKEHKFAKKIAPPKAPVRPIEIKEDIQNPEQAVRDLLNAYIRRQASLSISGLSPENLAKESARELAPLKARAAAIINDPKYGLSKDLLLEFVDMPMPEPKHEVTGASTPWEANDHPSYKPYVAPKIPEAAQTPKEEPVLAPRVELEKNVNTDWSGMAANIRSKMPEPSDLGEKMKNKEEREKAEALMQQLLSTYLRLQEGLIQNNLSPENLEREHAKLLGPLVADAQKIADKYGLSMEGFTPTTAPEKEGPVTGNSTEWEANDDPSYKPYRAPKVSDYPEAVKTPEAIPAPKSEMELLHDLILKALVHENAQSGAMLINTSDRDFNNSQAASALDTEIITLGKKLGLDETDLKWLAAEIATANGLVYTDPNDMQQHPDAEQLKKSPSGNFFESQQLGAEAVANREGMFFGERMTGAPDQKKSIETPAEEPARTPREKKEFFHALWSEANKTVPGFKDLSEGQQHIVMKGLHSRMLGKIQETAEAEFEYRVSKKNFIAGGWDRMWRSTITGAYEKRAFMEVGGVEIEEKTGIWNKMKSKVFTASEKIWKEADENLTNNEVKENQDAFLAENAKDLVDVVKDTKLDVIYWRPVMEDGKVAKEKDGTFKKGEAVINYSIEPDIRNRNTDPSHKNYKVGEVISDYRSQVWWNYNAAATDYSNIPAEWGTPDAKRSQRKAYEAAKEAFDNAKNEYLLEVTKWEEERNNPEPKIEAGTHVAKSAALAETMRFVFTHPEASERLEEIGTRANLRFSMDDDAAKERAALMGAGYAMRGSAVFAGFAAVSAPVVGALVGGTRGFFRSKEELAKMGKLRRRGEGRMKLTDIPEEGSEEWIAGGWNSVSEEVIKEIQEQNKAAKKRNLLTFGGGDISRHIERLDRYIYAIEKEEDLENQARLFSELETRVKFMEKKMELGQMNFGTKVGTQLDFMRKLFDARATIEAYRAQDGIEEIIQKYETQPDAVTGRNLNTFALRREKDGKEIQNIIRGKRERKVFWDTIRTAVIGAVLAEAGAEIGKYGPHLGWQNGGLKVTLGEAKPVPSAATLPENGPSNDTPPSRVDTFRAASAPVNPLPRTNSIDTSLQAPTGPDVIIRPADTTNALENQNIAPSDTLGNAPRAPIAPKTANEGLLGHPRDEQEILNTARRLRAEAGPAQMKISPEEIFKDAPKPAEGQDVSVSYENPKDFSLIGRSMRRADRISLRMLDRDFGGSHGLLSRHTIDTPEWVAIENYPVERALIDNGGPIIHSHKLFFAKLRTHGLEHNVLPVKGETVGHYAERVYQEMAKEKITGTEPAEMN